MHGDAQPLLVRLVDDGAVDLGRHLGRRAEVVVDADLHDVDFHRRVLVDQLARFFDRLRREHRPGDEEARAIERRRFLAVPRRDAGRLVVAEREDRRDAVGRVRPQILLDVLGGVFPCLEAHGIADVAVRVDQSGDDGLAGERHALGAGRDGDARRRADGDDASVAHEDGGVVDRRASRCRRSRGRR